MTEIKICGITRREDAFCAADCGADALGFIFHAPSPRCVSVERAKAIIAALPRRIVTVGVFVNRPAAEVEETVKTCGIDLIQLHGDESPEYCRLFAPDRLIKAVSPKTAEEVAALERYDVRAFLADAREAGRYGGTGKRADWELAGRIGKEHPLILAGGLDTGNIAAAMAEVAPAAVDINSGCEVSPGSKDPVLIERIVELIRERDRQQGHTGGAAGQKPVLGKPEESRHAGATCSPEGSHASSKGIVTS